MATALDKVVADLNKELGSVQIARASQALGLGYRRISTGILSLDIICGANSETEWGLPTGRVIELWGRDGSGKTTVALKTIKSAQDKGFCGAFISLENSWDSAWARRMGVDITRLIIARVASAEDAEKILYTLAQTPGVGVIVVDSLAMLTSASELATDFREKNQQPGVQAKAVNRTMRHIAAGFNAWSIVDPEALDQQPAIILLNQLREKIGAYGNPEYSPGGKGKDHQASIRIQMSQGPVIRKTKDNKSSPAYAVTLKARTNKNKVWSGHQSVEFLLYIRNVTSKGREIALGEVDELDQLFFLGKNYGLIEQAGSTFKYEQIIARGRVDFINQLIEYNAEREQLKEEIMHLAWEKRGL